MIVVSSTGSFSNSEKKLKKLITRSPRSILEKYGRKGVDLLSLATPVDSGATASSWSYEIKKRGENYTIYWKNSNTNKGINIAIILQYGHGTRTGGYVKGVDYINPPMKSIFESLAQEAWREVRSG